MAKAVVLDEIYIPIRIPHNLPDDRVEKIRTVVNSDKFTRRLRRSVRAAFLSFVELRGVSVSFSR